MTKPSGLFLLCLLAAVMAACVPSADTAVFTRRCKAHGGVVSLQGWCVLKDSVLMEPIP